MSEYVFRYAPGYGCDMGALMDGGRETVGDYFASDATDHYGTLHEEIVRCRNCRHYDAHTEPPECYREGPGRIVSPDGFCKWAKRREA